jgi:hypothetical protein
VPDSPGWRGDIRRGFARAIRTSPPEQPRSLAHWLVFAVVVLGVVVLVSGVLFEVSARQEQQPYTPIQWVGTTLFWLVAVGLGIPTLTFIIRTAKGSGHSPQG